MRAGQPGVVRDLRADMDSVVLRLAPVGAVDCFDLSVSWQTQSPNLIVLNSFHELEENL